MLADSLGLNIFAKEMEGVEKSRLARSWLTSEDRKPTASGSPEIHEAVVKRVERLCYRRNQRSKRARPGRPDHLESIGDVEILALSVRGSSSH